MAIQIRAEIDKEALNQILAKMNGLSDKKQNSARANAINKTARAFARQEKSDITKNFSAKKVGKHIIRRASPQKLEAEVVFPREAFNTSHFKVLKNRKKIGARVEITKGVRIELIYNGNKGFVPGLANNSVFARKGKKREPIDIMFGPSYGGMAHSDKFFGKNTDAVMKALEEELNRQIKRYIGK